jgi:DNA mismatch repair ATPase MutS
VLAAEGLFALPLRRRVQKIARDVELPGQDLALLADMLARLEAERFASPLLAQLRAALDTEGVPPSQRIKQLHRLINLLDARRNQLFAAIAPLLLWGTQFTLAIESWRSVSGPAIERWLVALGDFEALCSLSGYAYERADDPFPEIAESGPLFDGEGLGHPLLPLQRCVRNDVSLGPLRALVVSGSNMSGKSTLLRTVGTNAVLALAGAPVRAHHLKLSPLVVGTSMRIQDSLQEGTSRFYAEIQRLRQLVDLAQGPVPLLFLLDEILHGTNSHDRRIGAEAIVRGLLARDAIGLVTTHDLTLTQIADNLAPRAMNVHFEDHLENGSMSFDYRMRPGVVEKSNALALMRSVGLEV